MWQLSYNDNASLYLIPTPIGNLEDITIRAVNVIRNVDVIFAEDTRVTYNLLCYLKISKKLISLHEHNENVMKNRVLDYLKNGKSVGLVTDRGTPIISDPGYKTVKYITEHGFNVIALPGPCAFVSALVASGISADNFVFVGFLDSKKSKKKKQLENLQYYQETLIFYEAPHRILDTMKLILEVFGDRYVSLSREISKKYESIYRGYISDLIPTLIDVKGEFVIVVSGFEKSDEEFSEVDIFDKVSEYVEKGFSKKEAIKQVSCDLNLRKNVVYDVYHSLLKDGDSLWS